MMQRLVLPAFVLLAVFAVRAQEPPRQGGPGGFGLPRGFAIFQALDTDHDNTLTAAEIDAAPAALKAMDKNGDGKVTADEIPMPAGRGRGEGRGRGGSGVGDEAPAAPPTPDDMAATLMAFDRNKDGKLTKAEVPERMQGMFDRVDSNHDGVLTAEEIKAAAAAQPQPTAARPGGGEGRRGEGGREGGGPPPDRLFQALDKNGDGALSGDEIDAAAASLRTLDANGDGMLTPDEWFGGRGGRG
jgi:Ca2+-binding EF-hand superfamily protein